MTEQDSLTNDLIFKKEIPSLWEWRCSIYIIHCFKGQMIFVCRKVSVESILNASVL